MGWPRTTDIFPEHPQSEEPFDAGGYHADQARNDQKEREFEAIERLRDAAPDMLAALKMIAQDYTRESECKSIARAAIAKATGQGND